MGLRVHGLLQYPLKLHVYSDVREVSFLGQNLFPGVYRKVGKKTLSLLLFNVVGPACVRPMDTRDVA